MNLERKQWWTFSNFDGNSGRLSQNVYFDYRYFGIVPLCAKSPTNLFQGAFVPLPPQTASGREAYNFSITC